MHLAGGSFDTLATAYLNGSAATSQLVPQDATRGPVEFWADDAARTGTTDVLRLSHTTTSGLFGGANEAAAILWLLEDGAGNKDEAARMLAAWTTATSGSEASRIEWHTRFGGAAAAESMRLTAIGHLLVNGVESVPAEPNLATLGDPTTGLHIPSGTGDARLMSGGVDRFSMEGDGTVWQYVTSALTVTAIDALTIEHRTSGAAGAGFGAMILFSAEDAGGAYDEMGRIGFEWNSAVAAAECSDFVVYERYLGGAALETFRVRAGGDCYIRAQGAGDRVPSLKFSTDDTGHTLTGAGQVGYHYVPGGGGPGGSDILGLHAYVRRNATFYVGTNDLSRVQVGADGMFSPFDDGAGLRDNVYDLGRVSPALARWRDLYLGGSIRVYDSATVTTTDGAILYHETSGTPGTAYGTGLRFDGEDAGGNREEMAQVAAVWSDATNGSEDSDLTWLLRTAGAAKAEKMRLNSLGYLRVPARVAIGDYFATVTNQPSFQFDVRQTVDTDVAYTCGTGAYSTDVRLANTSGGQNLRLRQDSSTKASNLFGLTGVNGYLFQNASALGIGTLDNFEFAIGANNTARIRMDGTGLAFFAAAPIARPAAYTITNPASRRSFDTTTVTLPQLAEVVGTLLADFGGGGAGNYNLLQ